MKQWGDFRLPQAKYPILGYFGLSSKLRASRRVQKSIYTHKHQLFCDMLRQARKRKGMTQVELAKKLGTRQQWIAKVESGERRLDVIEFSELAVVLGIDPKRFFNALNSSSDSPTTKTARRTPTGI